MADIMETNPDNSPVSVDRLQAKSRSSDSERISDGTLRSSAVSCKSKDFKLVVIWEG